MGFIEIEGQRHEIAASVLELYHCASEEADFNLSLTSGIGQLQLAGTVAPAPKAAADLVGKKLLLEPRSIDEVFGALGQPITIFVDGGAARLAVEAAGDGLRLHTSFTFDWDRMPGDPPGRRHAVLELEATCRAFRP